MKITTTINGVTKDTSYGNKLYYRDNPSGSFTQIKRAFYRDSPNGNYTQIYLYDETAPSITITSSQTDTAIQSYTLTAVIVDTQSTISSITINGQNYSFVSGSSTVNLSKTYTLSTGTNTFTIRVVDMAGNVKQTSISFKYVNQKGDSNYDWTERTSYRDGGLHGTIYYYVKSRGSWVCIGRRKEDQDDEAQWNTSSITVNESAYLPKGLRSLTLTARSYGSGSYSEGSAGGTVTLSIIDQTTGETLFNQTQGSGPSIRTITANLNISASTSTHDLLVTVSGSANGREFNGSAAEVRITDWSFVYY